MVRRPSRRASVIGVVALCVISVVGVVALQEPATESPVPIGGPERAVQGGGADVRETAIKPTVYTGQTKRVNLTHPTQLKLKAATPKVFDMRTLTATDPGRKDVARNEFAYGYGEGGGSDAPGTDASDGEVQNAQDAEQPNAQAPTGISAPAPVPASNFDGLNYSEDCSGVRCGAGHPPDTNGDVGPTYYIQVINTAIGIFNKSSGALVSAVDFNTFVVQLAV